MKMIRSLFVQLELRKGISNMDFFEEIEKAKQDFPKVKSVTNEVKRYRLNFYQIFAIGMFVIFFFLGIFF